MKYLILGAGGTGGALGFALSSHQKDVTLLARGEHLAVMKAKGLTLHRLFDGTSTIDALLKSVTCECSKPE